eukprot:SAG22_NODE_5679_length_972_cov_1.875143_1_plen_134_part_00
MASDGLINDDGDCMSRLFADGGEALLRAAAETVTTLEAEMVAVQQMAVAEVEDGTSVRLEPSESAPLQLLPEDGVILYELGCFAPLYTLLYRYIYSSNQCNSQKYSAFVRQTPKYAICLATNGGFWCFAVDAF